MISRLALLVALVAAGCTGAADSELAGDDDGDLSPGSEDCVLDRDCVPAGSSCCECPSFSLPVASGWQDSCSDVDCASPGFPEACPLTEAVCEAGLCVLRCEATTCDTECAGGFTVDAAGCLVCECGDPGPPTDQECVVDEDCARVAADCCGCENGGVDTAVPSAEADAFTGEIECDSNPICPGVNTCDPALTARCLGGSCALAGEPGTGLTPDAGLDDSPADPQYCGDSTLPPCPEGYECVINHPDYGDASSAGLGVCLAR